MKRAAQDRTGTPVARGWRPRLSRAPLLFWWPAALLVLLTGWLWLLWPHGHGRYQRAARPMRMPEPGAAYVTLAEGAQSLYLKLDIFSSPSGLGFGRTQGGMDVREAPAVRVPPPPPDRLPAPAPGPWRLADVTPPPLPPPRLSVPQPDSTALITPVVTNGGVRVVLSPALRAAAFVLDLPRAALPPAPGRIRCHVELDASGRVDQLLLEKDEQPLDSHNVEAAVSQGRGAGPARGLVEIVWQ